MKITLTDGMNFINLDVDKDELVEDVKALIQIETKIPIHHLLLYCDGLLLKDSDKLSSRNVQQGAVLSFMVDHYSVPKSKIKAGSLADIVKNFDKKIKKNINQQGFEFNHYRVEQFLGEAKRLIEQLKNDPDRLYRFTEAYPQMASAVNNGNAQQLAKFMHRRNQQKIKELKEKQRKFIQLSKDPLNLQYQRMLQERIQQQNIDKNLDFATEYLPEAFGHITMLYIKASINKVPINAFVDSGAQSTIMSQSLAEKCGLMRLVDKRQAGKAVGVGSCKILGKVHAAEIEIEGKFLTCSFTVIENNSVQFLLGLDMLRRFNCVIDLGKNNLVFQGGMITTNFLSDGEVEKAKNPKMTKEQLDVKLKKITDMGFSKSEALQALRNCGYNEEVAGNILMQNKYGNK